MTTQYEEDYKGFINSLNSGIPVSSEEVGKLIVRMAQYFSDAVGELVSAETKYNRKLVEFEKTTDDNGKALTSTKAENYAKATDEYENYLRAKGHVNVIEQQINSLKALQKGLTNEYSHMGN